MQLSVNIDHVATIRNARGGTVPDPVETALIAERAGAKGIVCHLREDRRHIRDDDVWRLRQSIETKLDLEMAATEPIIKIALQIKPDLITLVPEKRQELTTEGGLDVIRLKLSLQKIIDRFHQRDILVSLFIDPLPEQIMTAKEIGSDMIELHTGEYANARTVKLRKRFLRVIQKMAEFGKEISLGVNAGHGLDYSNIPPVSKIKDIDEVSIGHAIIVRSLYVGLDRAVRDMVKLVRAVRKG